MKCLFGSSRLNGCEEGTRRHGLRNKTLLDWQVVWSTNTLYFRIPGLNCFSTGHPTHLTSASAQLFSNSGYGEEGCLSVLSSIISTVAEREED